MNLKDKLPNWISATDIADIWWQTDAEAVPAVAEELFGLAQEPYERLSANALWVLSHLPAHGDKWLTSKQIALTDLALKETNATKLRLMLGLLLRLPYAEESLRADFIDFCLCAITDISLPCAVRAVCIKLSYLQCLHYHELLSELANALDILDREELPPAIASAKRQTINKIKKERNVANRR